MTPACFADSRCRPAALCLLAGVVLAVSVIACAGDTATGPTKVGWKPQPPNPLSVTVTTDPTRVVAKRIVAAVGGTVTATGADGSRYTLVVPPGILPSDTTVTLTPVSAIASLPFSGGLSAAVQFGPEGLQLYGLATLTIVPAKAIPVERQITFGYHGSGSELYLAPLARDSAAVTLLVHHFSGVGLSSGGAGESKLQLQQHPPTSPEDQIAQQIQALVQNERILEQSGHGDLDTFKRDLANIFTDYYNEVVVWSMAAAVTDDSRIPDLAVALAWLRSVEFWLLGDHFVAQRNYIWQNIDKALTNAIEKGAARCRTVNGDAAARKLLGFVRSAQMLGFESSGDLTKLNECFIATLDVAPASAQIKPGESQAYTFVAKDGAGNVLPNMFVNWASSNPQVGTISNAGLAQGTADGSTLITAWANGVTSSPGVLQVGQSTLCGGAADVKGWTGTVSVTYAQKASTSAITLDVHEAATFTVNLASAGAGTNSWAANASSGTLAGNVKMNTVETDSGKPPEVTSYVADGAPALTLDSGQPASGVALTLDSRTCTYTLSLLATGNVTTTTSTSTGTGKIPIGSLRAGPRPISSKTATLSVDASVPAHLGAWRDDRSDAYFPSAGGPPGSLLWYLGFFGQQDAAGSATVSWRLTPTP